MRAPSSFLTLALPALALVACSSGGAPGTTDPVDPTEMTQAHNAARAAVMPPADPAIPDLTWSSTVAAAAQSWASECNFSHNTDSGMYGQNIYASTDDSTPQQVVTAWVGEAANYDYATNTCASGQVCGHYTQVVWRDSTELGCGAANCTTGSPFGTGSWQIYVCNYSPPGNFDGEKPY
jgi:pathogenesis-related protein 1